MPHISKDHLISRFTALILGGRDLPKKDQDLHILFISATLSLDPQREYSEAELNDELRKWSAQFGDNFALDHVTLRRFLIDAGYLRRNTAGSEYQLNAIDMPYTYDESLKNLDLVKLIEDAKREREERKQRYLKEAKG
ncbi:MAG TPA: DUF2087 domain-containing protein [Anaerolineales bacterium]|nr:DUF2087 domain-containing protein [Anaerolineales bacterium]